MIYLKVIFLLAFGFLVLNGKLRIKELEKFLLELRREREEIGFQDLEQKIVKEIKENIKKEINTRKYDSLKLCILYNSLEIQEDEENPDLNAQSNWDDILRVI